MKIYIGKIVIIQLAAALVLILVLPLKFEQFFGGYQHLSAVRYILAVAIAVPTVIYAVKGYRKTARRLYIFPCFMVALGFWVASMFFMQQELPESLYRANLMVAKRSNHIKENKPIADKRFHLTRNDHNGVRPLFLNETFKLKADTTFLN